MEATAVAVQLPRGRMWAGKLALAALLAAGAFALVVAGAVLTGHRALVVRSGSMEPAIRTGDLVLVRSVSPGAVEAGDIVTFRDATRDQELVTHRVVRVRSEGAAFGFVTKGDVNTGVERWSVDAGGTIGEVAFRIPAAGYVLSWLGMPYVRVGLMGIAVLVLLTVALRKIWT